VVLVALWPLRLIGRALFMRSRNARLIVEVREGESASPVLQALGEGGADPQSLEFDEEQGRRRIVVDMRLSEQSNPTASWPV
jgi:hypothetical protein